jgi:hypothetical protein
MRFDPEGGAAARQQQVVGYGVYGEYSAPVSGHGQVRGLLRRPARRL